MRNASAETDRKADNPLRVDSVHRRKPRRASCRREFLESLAIQRAADWAALVDCPSRR